MPDAHSRATGGLFILSFLIVLVKDMKYDFLGCSLVSISLRKGKELSKKKKIIGNFHSMTMLTERRYKMWTGSVDAIIQKSGCILNEK